MALGELEHIRGLALVVKRRASLQGLSGGADPSPCDASAPSGFFSQLGCMRPAGGFPRAAEAARPRKHARTTHFNDEATLFIYTPVTLASSTEGSDHECDGLSPPDGSPVAVAVPSASRHREGDAAGSVGPLRSQGGAVASHSVMGVGSVVAARPRQAPPVFLVRLSAPGREGASVSGLPDPYPSAAATKPAGVPPFENQADGKSAAMSTSSFEGSDSRPLVPAVPPRLPAGEGTPASPPGGEPTATAAPAPLSVSAPSVGGAPSRLPVVVPRGGGGGVERLLLMADSPTSTCSAGSARAMAETPAGAAALPGAPPKLVRGGEPIGAASSPAADTRGAAGLPVAPPPVRNALGTGGAPSLSNLRISAYPGACPPENRAATEYDESLTVPAAEARLASLAQSEAYRQSLRASAPPRIGLSIATPHSTAPPLLLRPVPPPTAVRDPGASKNRGGDDGSAAHASRRVDGAPTSRLSQFDKGRHPIPVRYEEETSTGAARHAQESAASSGSATRRMPSSRADAACLSRVADCDCCSPGSSALPPRVGDVRLPVPRGPEVHVVVSVPEPDSDLAPLPVPVVASSRPSVPDMDLAE